MNRIPADDTGLKVAGEKFNSERIERRPDGRNLIQDINTVPILFDHALNTGNLPGDTIGSAPDTFFGVDLHD